MFAVLDTAAGLAPGRPKTAGDRACDHCKAKKVRCNMARECAGCRRRGLACTYNDARKKRGPAPGGIARIRDRMHAEQQQGRERERELQEADGGSVLATIPAWAAHDTVGSAATTLLDTPSITHTPPLTHTPQLLSADDLDLDLDFIFPSLPIDSPSDDADLFGALPQQPPPPDIPHTPGATTTTYLYPWPSHVSQEALLPWIDVYFKRLHPTVPVLDRASLYRDMLLGRHRASADHGAMLLSLCAFAMTQPVRIHEVAAAPSRAVQARTLMRESVLLRAAVDFGEAPTLEAVLASFFLFACLFGAGAHRAARHRLREAVDLARDMGLDDPAAYEGLAEEERGRRLRTYLILAVTERAYALQRRHPIGFRGRPTQLARRLGLIDDAPGLTCLVETLDAVDEDVAACWGGRCRVADGACTFLDRRRAVRLFSSQRRVRETHLTGTATTPPVLPARLDETQQADVHVTQMWLLGRLWTLCLSHGLLRPASDAPELRLEFAAAVGLALLRTVGGLAATAMEAHGLGFIEKVFDVTVGVAAAVRAGGLALESRLDELDSVKDGDHVLLGPGTVDAGMTVRTLLQGLEGFVVNFRGGMHDVPGRLAEELGGLEGYYG